jgi:hypothetical protein
MRAPPRGRPARGSGAALRQVLLLPKMPRRTPRRLHRTARARDRDRHRLRVRHGAPRYQGRQHRMLVRLPNQWAGKGHSQHGRRPRATRERAGRLPEAANAARRLRLRGGMAATPAFVRDRLVELGERAGYSKAEAKLLASRHGPRHIATCFGARFNWTYETRAEFGMWNDGEDEVYWDGGLQRVLKRTRTISMTSVHRDAQPAKQQVQMRLFAAMKSAIRDTIQPVGYIDMRGMWTWSRTRHMSSLCIIECTKRRDLGRKETSVLCVDGGWIPYFTGVLLSMVCECRVFGCRPKTRPREIPVGIPPIVYNLARDSIQPHTDPKSETSYV